MRKQYIQPTILVYENVIESELCQDSHMGVGGGAGDPTKPPKDDEFEEGAKSAVLNIDDEEFWDDDELMNIGSPYDSYFEIIY